MEKPMLTGCMFIVPNGIVSQTSAFVAQSTREDWVRRLTWAGIEVRPEDLLVQVWWTNENCDNWRCHLSREWPALFGNIPDRLPARLFDGKKEGDKISFRLGGDIDAEVELRQLGFRYEWAGPFEQALARLLKVAE